MELITLTQKIESKIAEIEEMRKSIKPRAEAKANTASTYDLELAKTVVRLKNGDVVDIQGEIIKDPPATIMNTIAKGACHKQRLEMDLAEAMYKSVISNIEAAKSELNGLQSINRHLDNT